MKSPDFPEITKAHENILATIDPKEILCYWGLGCAESPLNKAQFKNVSFTSRLVGYLVAHGVPDIFPITSVKVFIMDRL